MSQSRITVGEASRVLGLSPSRVAQLDHVLSPERVGERRVRVFDRERVEQLAAERRATKEQDTP